MKFVKMFVSVALCAYLMLTLGVPIVEKTGAMVAAKFTSTTQQALDDMIGGGKTNVSVENLSNEISNITLGELLDTAKSFASNEITAEDVYNYYSNN